MAGSYIDLSRLPRPTVYEALAFDAFLAPMKAKVLEAMPDYPLTDADPVMMALRVCAGFRMEDRQKANDDAVSVLLAYAVGPQIDHLGALVGVPRLELTPADPETGTPAVMEDDDTYKDRVANGTEEFSVAGPAGAYRSLARRAHADVLDAKAFSPVAADIKQLVMDTLAAHGAAGGLVAAMQAALDAAIWPGTVIVSILSRQGDGEAAPEVLDAVTAMLSAEDRRPLTDEVDVRSAEIVPYAIEATIKTYAGPDPAIVIANAQASVEAYAARMRYLGLDVPTSGIYAALHVEGVQKVTLASPLADVVVTRQQASWCTDITLTPAGVGE